MVRFTEIVQWGGHPQFRGVSTPLYRYIAVYPFIYNERVNRYEFSFRNILTAPETYAILNVEG